MRRLLPRLAAFSHRKIAGNCIYISSLSCMLLSKLETCLCPKAFGLGDCHHKGLLCFPLPSSLLSGSLRLVLADQQRPTCRAKGALSRGVVHHITSITTYSKRPSQAPALLRHPEIKMNSKQTAAVLLCALFAVSCASLGQTVALSDMSATEIETSLASDASCNGFKVHLSANEAGAPL